MDSYLLSLLLKFNESERKLNDCLNELEKLIR